MQSAGLVRLTYWGGWASCAFALVYKLLNHLGLTVDIAIQTHVVPGHFWQLSFLLFLISLATANLAQTKGA